jgi:hypothetical protein
MSANSSQTSQFWHPKLRPAKGLRRGLAGLTPHRRALVAAAGLPLASPAERAWLASELGAIAAMRPVHTGPGWPGFPLRRTDAADIAAAALLSHWSAISAPLRNALMSTCGLALARQVRLPLPSGRSPRVSLAIFLGQAADPALFGHLRELFLDPDPEVAAAAEEALLAGLGRLGAADARIREHLGVLAEGFPGHRRRGILIAALRALDLPGMAFPRFRRDALAEWFADPRSDSQMALRSVLRRSTEPLAGTRAWQWLGRESLAAAALDRLYLSASPEERESILALDHLAENPARRKRLRSRVAREPLPLLAGGPDGLSAPARAGLIRLAALTQCGKVAEAMLASFLPDPEASNRLAACSRMVSAGHLLDFAYDADPAVAHHAVLRWTGSACEADQRVATLRRLVRSPVPAIRRIAREELASLDIFGPQNPRALATARRLLAFDRPTILGMIRAALRDPDLDRAHAAVVLLRRLELQAELELELLALVATHAHTARESTGQPGPAPRLLASAVGALGSLDTPAAAQAIQRLWLHPLARVRANLVESVGRREPGRIASSMIELKPDPSHRVRANAARAVLAVDPGDGIAGELLASMLGDERPLHRLAGLWAVERLSLFRGGAITPSFAASVTEMGDRDTEPLVRTRARRCAQRLVGILRARWTQSAPDLASPPPLNPVNSLPSPSVFTMPSPHAEVA